MSSVQMTRADSVNDVIEQMQQRISVRAYDLFRGRGEAWGNPWEDWFTAEREMVRRPAVELSEQNGSYTVLASLAGVDARQMQVKIAPQDLVIKAESEHRHESKDRKVHECDFRGGAVFRSVHFPRPVDMSRATADFHDGLLTVRAPIAPEPASRKLEVKYA